MALTASSFAGAAVRALSTRSTSRMDRSNGLVCRAEDKMARNTIDLDKRKIGPGTGKPIKVTFLGADNQNVTVECPEDQYILDAGIDAGLELPFTCRGGICGACVARCTQGPAGIDHRDITDLEFTLDEDEQADGLALLCMCYPVGDITLETQSDWGMRVGEWKGATGEISGREPTKLMTGELKGL
jgi:2Fe-2S type ferredoxin